MMVFATVGTHEQQFDRLVRAVDELAASELAGERVFIQTGYSDYQPAHCEWSKFVEPVQMAELMRDADVVITHGGPSSFIEAMAAGKTPVVVPRRADLGEHVNDHQAEFIRFVAERQGGILAVEDVEELGEAIEKVRAASAGTKFASHNEAFCDGLLELVRSL